MSVTDEIKARVDAVDFISRYVPLQRAGRSFKACCPFHQERTPSFVVFPESGSWHCFGACSTGGDIFSFLMQKERMDFREALQTLAQETGVQLPEETDDRNAKERDHMTLTLVITLLYEDPALSEELYAKLTDAEVRQNAAAVLYRYWQDRDPERADRYRAPAGV